MTSLPGAPLILTALAMIAFAANSVIARLALDGQTIGPGAFTGIRIISGALILVLIILLKTGSLRSQIKKGNWLSALCLFLYAVLFSYAYLSISAGTGALILFAAVQMTMVGSGILFGERLNLVQTLGALTAISGLVYWLGPSDGAPPIAGAIMMIGAGIAWGLYSLHGRNGSNPTLQTTGNFIRAAMISILILPSLIYVKPELSITAYGLGLALLSGIMTSALGYVIWYAALKHLSAIKAGLVQLTVPVIAAIGGIIFISEPLTLEFALTAFFILSGVALATLTQRAE